MSLTKSYKNITGIEGCCNVPLDTPQGNRVKEYVTNG
jgi:hypothetical protein